MFVVRDHSDVNQEAAIAECSLAYFRVMCAFLLVNCLSVNFKVVEC